MSILFGDLKTAVRANVFPTGEAPNLVAAHDKMFVDCLVDLQTVVECLQQDHTDVYPQCSTFYDCQMTVFPAPRGIIQSVSVVDKIDPTTHQESTTAPTDYCARIYYTERDACQIKAWQHRGGCARGDCMALPLFFGLPCDLWGSGTFPFPPTDAGVPPGLPPLPFAFHYAQTSTDRVSQDGTTRWRARAGVWAKERGNIYVVPWIQSTETIMVVWDGIKRTFQDDEQVDDDPLLSQAIEEYVRWRHEDKYGHDAEEAARAGAAYALAKQALIHQCREETRVRECESSKARSSVPTLQTSASLFYNTVAGVGSAACADGSNPVSFKIPVGAVSSTKSVADANQSAQTQADAQAKSMLNCPPPGGGEPVAGFPSDPVTFTASCVASDPLAPPPSGDSVTVSFKAGLFRSPTSAAAATQLALAEAQKEAGNQLKCTWHNPAVTVSLTCPTDSSIVATFTVNAGNPAYDSTHSQEEATNNATVAANNGAQTLLHSLCPDAGLFYNTFQFGQARFTCGIHTIIIDWTVAANFISADTQRHANDAATKFANDQATLRGLAACQQNNFGTITLAFP